MACDAPYRDRGFVLVNALIIVAALAGAAVFLLARADAGRVRLQTEQSAGQLGYYLDAFEALSVTLLNQDMQGGDVDHPGEDWAKADYNVPLDRGQVSGVITDMQGLFNLNWLTDPTNLSAPEAFDLLLARNGISPSTGDAIRAFMQPGGPRNRQIYAASRPALDPVGGALFSIEQLADIPNLAPDDLAKLKQVATVLPGDSKININMIPADILAGFVPQVRPAALSAVLITRTRVPFTSVDAFMEALNTAAGQDLSEDVDASRFSVASDWFGVRISAELQGQTASRTSVLRRFTAPTGTVIYWHSSSYR